MLFLNIIPNSPSSGVMKLSHISLITPQPWRSRRRTLSVSQQSGDLGNGDQWRQEADRNSDNLIRAENMENLNRLPMKNIDYAIVQRP